MKRRGERVFPISILTNYWEIHPHSMDAHFDQLKRRGVQQITSFVPWQLFESDISHLLLRFLQAAYQHKMRVRLIPTPEPGVHFPHSGVPKDLSLSRAEQACDEEGDPFLFLVPPLSFSAPSLFSTELTKKFFGFLARFNVFLRDLARSDAGYRKMLRIGVSSSFWKYYRSPKHCSPLKPFAGVAGDHGKEATLAFRRRVEEFFSQKEFAIEGRPASSRWKAAHHDAINRKWFNQYSEDLFRHRCRQVVRKGGDEFRLENFEVFTPEADPAQHYSRTLQLVSGGKADFHAYSRLLDEYAARLSVGPSHSHLPLVHWTSLGGFRTLPEAERQFLILKSLLLMGGRGGGILVDEHEWFLLSQAFRSRATALARYLSSGDLGVSTRCAFLSPELWSEGTPLWRGFHKALGPQCQRLTSVEHALEGLSASMIVLDSELVITDRMLIRLIRWASETGRVLVLPKSDRYTKSALEDLSQITEKGTEEKSTGLELYKMSKGWLFLYEPTPEGALSEGHWEDVANCALKRTEFESLCRVGDPRLSSIILETSLAETSSAKAGVFLLNGTARPVSADLSFRSKVNLGDLTLAMGRSQSVESEAPVSEAGERFDLEVPPCGILPLSIEGIDRTREEKREARRASRESKRVLKEAADAVLPGLEDGEGFQ